MAVSVDVFRCSYCFWTKKTNFQWTQESIKAADHSGKSKFTDVGICKKARLHSDPFFITITDHARDGWKNFILFITLTQMMTQSPEPLSLKQGPKSIPRDRYSLHSPCCAAGGRQHPALAQHPQQPDRGCGPRRAPPAVLAGAGLGRRCLLRRAGRRPGARCQPNLWQYLSLFVVYIPLPLQVYGPSLEGLGHMFFFGADTAIPFPNQGGLRGVDLLTIDRYLLLCSGQGVGNPHASTFFRTWGPFLHSLTSVPAAHLSEGTSRGTPHGFFGGGSGWAHLTPGGDRERG